MPSYFAPAKINLYLHVTGKRHDGYHLLDTLVMFANVGDNITVQRADDIILTIDGPFADGLPTDENNLVIKAAHLLQQNFGIEGGAHIHLNKQLPLASGIGGGSSDAAATLMALNDLWNINASKQQLAELALPLGADLPMCLAKRTAIVQGIGDIITPLDIKETVHLVLVNCKQTVSSADIFRTGITTQSGKTGMLDFSHGIAAAIKPLNNDLSSNAQHAASGIETTLDALRSTQDCALVRMSGSGATCFGIYPSQTTAQTAAQDIKEAHADWWVTATHCP